MGQNVNFYADAFFMLALEEKKEKEFFEDLKTIKMILNDNPQLISLLASYMLTNDEKSKIIDEDFISLNVIYSKNFIKILVKNHLIQYFDKVYDCYQKKYNKHFGISEGIIYSSVPLSKSEIKMVEMAFKKKKNQNVILINKIDKSLISGLKVVIDDCVYDNTIKNQLIDLKFLLKKEGQ